MSRTVTRYGVLPVQDKRSGNLHVTGVALQ